MDKACQTNAFIVFYDTSGLRRSIDIFSLTSEASFYNVYSQCGRSCFATIRLNNARDELQLINNQLIQVSRSFQKCNVPAIDKQMDFLKEHTQNSIVDGLYNDYLQEWTKFKKTIVKAAQKAKKNKRRIEIKCTKAELYFRKQHFRILQLRVYQKKLEINQFVFNIKSIEFFFEWDHAQKYDEQKERAKFICESSLDVTGIF